MNWYELKMDKDESQRIFDDYCASIQYFIENECGAVATKKEEIETELLKLYNNRELLKSYAEKGWESGKKHHHKPIMQNMVKQDLNNLLKYSLPKTEEYSIISCIFVPYTIAFILSLFISSLIFLENCIF